MQTTILPPILQLLDYSLVYLALIPIIFYMYSILALRFLGPSAPLFGVKSPFDARVIANYRFYKDAASIVNVGYNKYKNAAFWFARNDADIVVLPVKHVEEIRNLSSQVANPTLAHAHNLLGRYTKMDVILKSNLHFRVIQNKLTPQLSHLTEPMQEELQYGMEHDFPKCDDDWIEIHPYHLLLRLVSRISARVFIGLPLCRSEKWLEISTQFTENIFITVCLMRLLPTWLHPIASVVLPSNWRSASYIAEAKKLLVPEIKRRRAEHSPEAGPEKGDQSKQNLLSWMMEVAQGLEHSPTHLAHLEIVVSLASIHTSQMNAVHAMYDLATHPEYIEPLREEIREAARADGGWNKTSYAHLRKLDSFLKESQRFNPPSLLSYHRVMERNHVLSDGTRLSKGTHIAMAVNAIQNDPNITPEPTHFDGLRYYKLRERPGESHLHQFATTENTLLNFGHGKNACPGRFFASLEIKVILVQLIMNYDFKLVGGKRPENLTAHEFIFPNPEGRLLVKARPMSERFSFGQRETA